VVICTERGADLHTAQLMPLSLTVSCFSEIQIGFTSLVPAHPGSPGKGPLNVCVCVCVTSISGRVAQQDAAYCYRCVPWSVSVCLSAGLNYELC